MYALRRFNYILSHGLVTRELRNFIRHKTTKRQPRLLPEVGLSELIGSGVSREILEEKAVEGNVSVEELDALAAITALRRPRRIFEIGTYDGRTTINLAANSPQAEVFTLDLPQKKLGETRLRLKSGDRKFADKPASGGRFVGSPYASRITQLYDDSAAFDSGPYEGSIDLVFVDGAHSYEYVISDTELALRLLRDGKGTILWHDYCWSEVVRALNEFYRLDPRFKGMVNIEGTTLAYLHLK